MAAAIPFAAAAFQVAGSLYSGYSQAAGMRAQARADDANAELSRQAAANAMLEAGANEDMQRRKSAGQMSSQAAALAESGIGMDSGTALDLTQQSALNAEMDALNIRYAGKLKANNLYTEAANFENSASMNRANARGAVVGGWLNAGANALSSYGNYTKGQAATVRAGKTTGGVQ